ncbi:S1 family peptidase [Chondromyces apiculatus]|uniref:Peptidase S1 domain-containing protein n=1 Tax=Chondromyces apiculatus DSM 436 TaxID=1192034 RepID=A0A017STB4_9BACT|nr:trypsin-like serine protease [Chondromyces apiculatus]EYF00204.1 Hypothetical protein CAP_1077 [Chondromyces apiculatus DSM 436]
MRLRAGAALVTLTLVGVAGCGAEDASGEASSSGGPSPGGSCAEEAGVAPPPGRGGGRGGDGEAKATGEATLPILGGALATGDAAVVAVNSLGVDCQRAGAPGCTGTLVGADLVLTAAHCVGEMPPERFVVLFGATADPGRGELGEGLVGQLFHVAEIRVHEGFDPETLAGDVAVLRLAEAGPATPVAVAGAGFAGVVEGAAGRVVGFGRADEPPAFAKREGAVVVSAVSETELVYEGDPAMTCAGDSGGPVFMTVEGVERLVGVTSRGDAACEQHGVAVRMDALPPSLLAEAW